MNKSEGKGGVRYVCSVFRGLRSVVGITEISLSTNVEVSGKDKGKCLCCGVCCSGVAVGTATRDIYHNRTQQIITKQRKEKNKNTLQHNKHIEQHNIPQNNNKQQNRPQYNIT